MILPAALYLAAIAAVALSFSLSSNAFAADETLIASKHKNSYSGAIDEIHKRRYRRAHKHLKELAESGHAKSQTILGFLYEKGLGVEKDAEKAFSYYKKAAAQGLAEAESRIGHLLLDAGDAMKVDEQDAFSWLESAANQGVAEAQLTMGKLYREGKHVPLSNRKATIWLRKAADQGNDEARKMLEEIPGFEEAEVQTEKAEAGLRAGGRGYEKGMGNITRSWTGYADIVNEIKEASAKPGR